MGCIGGIDFTAGTERVVTKAAVGRWARENVPPGLYRQLCRLYDWPRGFARRLMCVGFGRTCPFCSAHLRRFLSDPGEPSPLFAEVPVVGGGPIEQALCPRCRSFERERHVYLYLQRMSTVFSVRTRMWHRSGASSRSFDTRPPWTM